MLFCPSVHTSSEYTLFCLIVFYFTRLCIILSEYTLFCPSINYFVRVYIILPAYTLFCPSIHYLVRVYIILATYALFCPSVILSECILFYPLVHIFSKCILFCPSIHTLPEYTHYFEYKLFWPSIQYFVPAFTIFSGG